VELIIQLPTGVELQSISPNDDLCETDNLPTVTCLLPDLSVNSADSLSHVTIDLAVELTDPGLLLLTTEAKVSANEYPSHSDRERTKIFIDPNVKVDMVFVIDDSNSMQQEINDIIVALKQFIANVDANSAPFIALVTFKDQVTVRAASRDMNVLLAAIEKLKASGGGMCEEASAEALEIAIKHLKEGGSILLATDASPYNDADIEGLVELLNSKTMKLNALLTGDCASQDSWNGLP
jgi:predicted nucleic-acid-binding protein